MALAGMVSVMSPTGIGVQVATGEDVAGKVAVCVSVPMDAKAMFGPSLTMRMLFPAAGNAVDVLAVDVTLTSSVDDCAENG